MEREMERESVHDENTKDVHRTHPQLFFSSFDNIKPLIAIIIRLKCCVSIRVSHYLIVVHKCDNGRQRAKTEHAGNTDKSRSLTNLNSVEGDLFVYLFML